MNWTHFQTRHEAPDQAFEAFVSQVFERWCRHVYGKELRDIVFLEGKGGDGGVEAFASLSDGGMVGLQAKWYLDGFDSNRATMVKASITQAMLRYPELRRYVVSMPQDLSNAKKSKGHVSQLDRWNKIKTWAADQYPDLALELWGATALEQHMIEVGGQELEAYWFQKSLLTLSDLHDLFRRTRSAWFMERYLPDLHCVGRLDEAIWQQMHTTKAREAFLKRLTPILRTIKHCIDEVERLPCLPGFMPEDKQKQAAIAAAGEQLEGFNRLALDLEKGASQGRLQPCLSEADAPMCPPYEAIGALHELLDQEERKSVGFPPTHNCDKALGRLGIEVDELATLRKRYLELFGPMSVTGQPGSGKTHGVVSCCDKLVADKRPVLLIPGRAVDPQEDWATMLSSVMDLRGWSTREILTALEATAYFAERQMHSGADPNTGPAQEPFRVLIAIDGLEESPHSHRWPERLAELRELLISRPRLVLVCTTRDETAATCLGDSLKGFRSFHLYPEDLPLGEVFRKYCDYYHVQVEHTTWLPWALRTPLAVRLFTELNKNSTVTADATLLTTVPALLKEKLCRIETEVRASKEFGWPKAESLLSISLSALARRYAQGQPDLTHDEAVRTIREAFPDQAFISRERANHILGGCRIHGILDSWRQAAKDPLKEDEWHYRPAFNAITDYLLASDIANEHLEALKQGRKPKFPQILQRYPDAASVTVAILADGGHFIVQEGIWENDVNRESRERWQLRALSSLPKESVNHLDTWVQEVFLRSMPSCRLVLDEIVIPVARIPGHTFGARFVDEILRPLQVAKRDLFWSGPDFLPQNHGAVWEGHAEWHLDDSELFDEDLHDGMPLLLAWSCTSVVLERRSKARQKLAVWGGRNPTEMAALLGLVAKVNDPQMVEDVLVAAAGAAMSCAYDDASLLALAQTCDWLFFAENAQAPTNNAITRHAARLVIERARAVGHAVDDATLRRARPPYLIDRDKVLPFAFASADEPDILFSDLGSYVANEAVKDFFGLLHTDTRKDVVASTERPFAEVDIAVLNAAKIGLLSGLPADVVKSANEEITLRELERKPLGRIDVAAALDAMNKLTSGTADPVPAQVEETGDLAPKAVTFPTLPWREEHYSEEAARLLSQYAKAAELEKVTPPQLRNALIVAHVKNLGWNREQFHGKPTGGKPGEVVMADIAIIRQYFPATHGSRSPVASFCEKYVWSAVNEIAGYLADCLPHVEGYAGSIEMVEDYGGLGGGMPDPFIHRFSAYQEVDPSRPWIPSGLVPELAVAAKNQRDHATEWLRVAPIPDVSAWPFQDEPDGNLAVLSAMVITHDPKSLVKCVAWVTCFAIPRTELALLKRDVSLGSRLGILSHLGSYSCWLGDATYISPSVAAWAPWLKPREGETSYTTLGSNGFTRDFSLQALTARVFYESEGGETTVWLPAPLLRDAWGITDGRGDDRQRHFVNRQGEEIACYQCLRDVSDYTELVEVLWARRDSVQGACDKQDLAAGWYVRVYREIPWNLFKNGERPQTPWVDHRFIVIPCGDSRGSEVVPVPGDVDRP